MADFQINKEDIIDGPEVHFDWERGILTIKERSLKIPYTKEGQLDSNRLALALWSGGLYRHLYRRGIISLRPNDTDVFLFRFLKSLIKLPLNPKTKKLIKKFFKLSNQPNIPKI